jgi:hypothetical protein
MYNDSIESLLLRHYGETSPVPEALEQRLVASVRQEAAEVNKTERMLTSIYERPISRRRVVRWVALGTAGLGALSASLTSLQPADSSKPAYA